MEECSISLRRVLPIARVSFMWTLTYLTSLVVKIFTIMLSVSIWEWCMNIVKERIHLGEQTILCRCLAHLKLKCFILTKEREFMCLINLNYVTKILTLWVVVSHTLEKFTLIRHYQLRKKNTESSRSIWLKSIENEYASICLPFYNFFIPYKSRFSCIVMLPFINFNFNLVFKSKPVAQ